MRSALSGIGGEERVHWESRVLAMRVGEQMTMPRTWVVRAGPTLEAIGPELLGRRLTEWWPSGPKESLQGSGAQLLKHFIWSLGLLDHPSLEDLVTALADIDCTPKRPMAVLKPAAAALEGATSEAGRAALQRIRAAIAG